MVGSIKRVVVVGVLGLIGAATEARAGFMYSDFKITDGLYVLANADTAGGKLYMNEVGDGPNQDGWAWRQWADTPAEGFSTTFTFRYENIWGIKDANGNIGTDGIAFELEPYSNHYQPYDFYNARGLSVWYDAFDNGTADVSSSRVAVYDDGVLLGQFNTEPLGIYFRDQQAHTSRVTLTGTTLDVWVDGQLVGETNQISLPNLASAYAGFVGSTAAAYADQELLSWQFEAPEPGVAGMVLVAAGVVPAARRRRG